MAKQVFLFRKPARPLGRQSDNWKRASAEHPIAVKTPLNDSLAPVNWERVSQSDLGGRAQAASSIEFRDAYYAELGKRVDDWMEKVNNLSLRGRQPVSIQKAPPLRTGVPRTKSGFGKFACPACRRRSGKAKSAQRDSSRFVFRSSQAKLLDGPQENSNLRYKGGVSTRSGVSIFPSASGQEFQVLPQAIVRSQEDKSRGQVESGDSRLPLGLVSLFSLPSIHLTHGRLAQLVRATGLHPVGHRFESCAVHHLPLSFFMRHVISVLVENKFGVLARIAGLFSGRGFNIDTLNAGPTHLEGRSRITVTLNGDEKALEQCINQLDKLIDVIEVNNFVGGEGVGRELVLVKIRTDSETRSEVTQLCDVFRGKIIDVSALRV